jgi:hypothetical protein
MNFCVLHVEYVVRRHVREFFFWSNRHIFVLVHSHSRLSFMYCMSAASPISVYSLIGIHTFLLFLSGLSVGLSLHIPF